MDRLERLNIWNTHLANARDRLATLSQRHAILIDSDPALYAKIENGCKDSIKTAEKNVEYYS